MLHVESDAADKSVFISIATALWSLAVEEENNSTVGGNRDIIHLQVC